jgi:long-chain acyl-CoA synthetase
MNLKSLLEETAARYGEKDAIVFNDRRISYSELDKTSNQFANTLIDNGISQGDRVALLLSNRPEFVIAFFGIVKTGAIVLPLDPQYRADELVSLFEHSSPAALVSESPAMDILGSRLSGLNSIRLVLEAGDKQTGRFSSFDEILKASPPRRIDYEPETGDVAAIFYTSASSFQPRGAMLSHRSMVMEAVMSAEGYRQTDKDIMMLFALPMFHVYGLEAGLLASIYKGSTVVIVPGTGLSIGSFMAAVESERGTIFIGVPYIFALAVDMAKKEGIKNDLSSLRLCASAGAPLSVDTAVRFKELYGYDIMNCYGLTEAIAHVTCPSLNGSISPGSAGKTLSDWEIKIVDSGGRELPPGQAGEIIVAGPLMDGYYNDPKATGEVIKDGWLYSGDIGMADEDGNLFVTGRKKDTIIVKGQNINPIDIESVLATHPAVSEVAVMGIPDKMRGEIIGAVISLREGTVVTEQEIRQFCLERLASYKAPKQTIFTGPLPKTVDGEIDKDAIRERLSLPPVFPVL